MLYKVDLRHGVQGVECSNHSVPTKISYKIQSLSGDWIFYFRSFSLVLIFFLTEKMPPCQACLG